MKTREIGTSGIQVSVIGLGCNNFGFFQDGAQARACVHRALDVGITLFDMASEHGMGREEELVGAALGARRKDVVIATKFGQQELTGIGPDGSLQFSTDRSREGASRRWILHSVEESLRRLKTDYIDLYQLHVLDPAVPIDETLRALHDLVQQGKVRAIGLAATFATAADLVAMDEAATAQGLATFASMQSQYNLLVRDAEADLVPALRQRRMSLLPFWPLANGLLSGKYRQHTPPAPGTRLQKLPVVNTFYQPQHWQRVEAIRQIADARGIGMVELALGWLLAQPVVSSVIAGASSPAQVAQNAAAAALGWSAEDFAGL